MISGSCNEFVINKNNFETLTVWGPLPWERLRRYHCKFFSNSVPVNKSHSQTVNFWKKIFVSFDSRMKIMLKKFFVHRSVNRNSQDKSHIHSLWTLWTKKSENAYFDPKSKKLWKNFVHRIVQSSQICSQGLNLKKIYSVLCFFGIRPGYSVFAKRAAELSFEANRTGTKPQNAHWNST